MNRTLAASLALATVAALTACGDKSTASQSPSQTLTSAGTTPVTNTPTSKPPVSPTIPPLTIPPAAASGLTVTSAESFARFYFEALGYLVATGDPTLTRQWADKNCLACKTLADHYQTIYEAGGSITGDTRVRVTQVIQVRLIRKDTAAVVLKAREGKKVQRNAPGATPTTYPPGTLTWDLTLAAAGNHWTMFEMVTK